MVVSHDRYFLNRVCNGILAFENGKEIYYSEGDYDYYIEKRNHRRRQEEFLKPKASKNTASKTRVKPKPKKMSFKDALELEQIEKNIVAAESEVERIEYIFALPDYYEKYASQTNELNLQLKEAKEKVKMLYERWEELEKIKNEITQAKFNDAQL